MKGTRSLLILAITVVSVYGVGFSWAADYPVRPITLINPMAPGGSQDIQSRAYAAVVEKYLGQPMLVVNKPGATGMVGSTAGAQAPPDGYTLTVGSNNIANSVEWDIANGRKPALSRQDFLTVGAFSLSPNLIAVHPESPWKTLGDFVRDAKAKPGHYAFSSGGLYGMSHIPVEIFCRAAGIKLRHVPYTGGGPALSALVGKHVDMNAPAPSTGVPMMQGNKVRLLAVLGDKRLKVIPEIPTAQEQGIKAEYYMWVGILVPAKTPAPIVERLRDATRKAAEDKAFRELIEKTGEEIRFMSSEELSRFWESEFASVGPLMKELVKEAPK